MTSPNDPVTPADAPSSPAGYASVTPHGRGPAPYEIQADNGQDVVTAAFNAANDDAGAGVLYPKSARQQETETLLSSPQGFASGGYDIDSGSAFGWPTNIEPGG